MLTHYGIPIVLLFLSIIIFKLAFKKFGSYKKSPPKIEKFEESADSLPKPNDKGVQLLYEIRGMMLNHQNEIDKRLEAISDKKETGIVLDKMSELEAVLKGEPNKPSKADVVEMKEDKIEEDSDPKDEPSEKVAIKAKKKTKKSKKESEVKQPAVEKQLIDEDSDDDVANSDPSETENSSLEPFVQGMEYCTSATNCYEL